MSKNKKSLEQKVILSVLVLGLMAFIVYKKLSRIPAAVAAG